MRAYSSAIKTVDKSMASINLRREDLNLLTVFEAVYEERIQSKAGERLGMSQPAISHAQGRLRYQGGNPLLWGEPRDQPHLSEQVNTVH